MVRQQYRECIDVTFPPKQQLLTPHNLFLSAFLLRSSCTYAYVYLCYTHTHTRLKNILHTYVNRGASSYSSSISRIATFWNMTKCNSLHKMNTCYILSIATRRSEIPISVCIPIHLNDTPHKCTIWNLPCDQILFSCKKMISW